MTYQLLTALIGGWMLDLIFGDPIKLPHPIVYIGKWIAWGEHWLNKGKWRMTKGAVFNVASIALAFTLTWFLLHAMTTLGNMLSPTWGMAMEGIKTLLMTILVFFCLAGKTLRNEVEMVFKALERGIEDGRKQVARIVGRDTQQLSEQEVGTAALETLAENLSDGVVAPVFWLCLLGVPGMIAYKTINTFDSMIGYKTERYKRFGCWAAHIDDIANYIPARITALLIAVVGWVFTCVSNSVERRKLHIIVRQTLHFADHHASPNSGWPEAALSSVLDCRFGGTHNYFGKSFYKPFIGTNPRTLTTTDMKASINICLMAEIVCMVIAAVVINLWN